jgi:hypothetical protein
MLLILLLLHNDDVGCLYAAGQRYFPPEWSMDGGRRMWSALCGFEPLPHETVDISHIRGVDRGVMKLVS